MASVSLSFISSVAIFATASEPAPKTFDSSGTRRDHPSLSPGVTPQSTDLTSDRRDGCSIGSTRIHCLHGARRRVAECRDLDEFHLSGRWADEMSREFTGRKFRRRSLGDRGTRPEETSSENHHGHRPLLAQGCPQRVSLTLGAMERWRNFSPKRAPGFTRGPSLPRRTRSTATSRTPPLERLPVGGEVERSRTCGGPARSRRHGSIQMPNLGSRPSTCRVKAIRFPFGANAGANSGRVFERQLDLVARRPRSSSRCCRRART